MGKPTTHLKRLLSERLVIAPGAFNALVARLIEQSGFEAVYVSGAGLANSFGLPDIGLLTLTEVAQQVKWICEAVSLPVLVDVDTGFGEAINVARTVRELERVGAAGIHLEDQEFPKRCGHLPGKRCVPIGAMVEKIQAALEARRDPDFLLIARTDARSVEGFSAAVKRAQSYLEAGADGIFPEALESEEEFVTFAKEIAPAFSGRPVLLLANMTEFGKTPYIPVPRLAEFGYRLVIFPLTAMRVALKAIQEALTALKREGTQVPLLDRMMSRAELYALLGYDPKEPFWQGLKATKKSGGKGPLGKGGRSG